jgi:hypothetical protein
MSNDVIFLTFILIMQLIGLATIWYQEIKPKLDGLYTKCKELEQKVSNVEVAWEAHRAQNNKWVDRINEDLSIESLNKIMQQHIEGTSTPIKNKIEEVVEEYNERLKGLKSKGFCSKRESGVIGEIIVYEDDIDYIIFTMRNKYGNSKKDTFGEWNEVTDD